MIRTVTDRIILFLAGQIEVSDYPVDENGFLDPFQNSIPNGYGFIAERDYLNSIPLSQIVLNPENLT